MTRRSNNELESLAGEILASYRAESRTQRIGGMFLPSRDRIVKILNEVRQLLFPGYFGSQRLTEENTPARVTALLARLGEDLADQIRHCLCMDRHCDECPDPDECRRIAEGQARAFLARVPKIRAMLALDVQAAYDGDPAAKSMDEIIYCYPGYFAVTVYRVAHELHDLGVPLMPRIMTEFAHGVTGTDIHPGATIGESFFIDHATGVVIGETTVIGDHVKIYQGVTLGALSFPKDERGRVIRGIKRHPTLEDQVTIYANATILGGETVIGRGVTVAGNTFVTEAITAGSLVKQEGPRLQVLRKNRGKSR